MENPIGRVASPPQLESTSEKYYLWIQRGCLVEKNQIVVAKCSPGGQAATFYGSVIEVRRRSRKNDITEEFDEADGEVTNQPAVKAEGITYAAVNILKTDPLILTPPVERALVCLGNEADAALAYGVGDMTRPMGIGRLYNGGDQFAGLAKIDLAYLLGDNGGHLNVSGMAGVGAKSSLLLVLIKLLLHEARNSQGKPPLHVVPIILNVKGEDLMWIDQGNRNFKPEHNVDWNALGVPAEPFRNVEFFTPTDPGTGAPTIDGCAATAYSWSLSDIIQEELFIYLFSGGGQ